DGHPGRCPVRAAVSRPRRARRGGSRPDAPAPSRAIRAPQRAALAMPLLAVAVVSAAVLAYEVLLTRLFSIVQWHHFAYMVSSIALLGYGASGTFLALAQHRLQRHFAAVFAGSPALFGLSSVIAF